MKSEVKILKDKITYQTKIKVELVKRVKSFVEIKSETMMTKSTLEKIQAEPTLKKI